MDGKANLAAWGLLVAGAVFLLLDVPARVQYGGGSGTAEDPYLIATAGQMNAIGLHPEDSDKHFRLVADIDLKDLGLVNPDVRPAPTCGKWVWSVGILAGQLSRGSIGNCYVEGGHVQGERGIGGLVGESYGTISDCHATCTVRAAQERPLPAVPGQFGHRESFGGLVGETGSAVSNCWSAGDVSGDSSAGGLVGTCHRPTRLSETGLGANARGGFRRPGPCPAGTSTTSS